MAETMTIIIHRAELPPTIHGAVTRSGEDFLIVLNEDDDHARQLAAFLHEMTHIFNRDLDSGAGNVLEIEKRTREQLREALRINCSEEGATL